MRLRRVIPSRVVNPLIKAHKAGIKTIIISRSNKVDLEEIPSYVKAEVKFVLADDFDDVFKVAF